jgi:hypothetical protein
MKEMKKYSMFSKMINRTCKRNQVNYPSKILLLIALAGFNACGGDWLDVVPDGVATIDMAFNSRAQTYKYLATCYSYMPSTGNVGSDPTIVGGDEIWTAVGYSTNYAAHNIAKGSQSPASPILESWGGMYQALRDCNTFLENVGKVPDLPMWERDQWIAEVKVLKAFYHFWLVRMYGPVPLIRENILVSADVSTVKVVREPVDDCFQYIVDLLDEAAEGDALPMAVMDPAGELGRITKPIAMALKAKVLVTAASPLYNGNNDMATLRNRDGTPLFNATGDPEKWQKAVVSCKEAIEACHKAGIELYYFPNTGLIKYSDTIATQLSLRNAFNMRWTSDIIWANTQSIADNIQLTSAPRLDIQWKNNTMMLRNIAPPLKMASLFYTGHGVPLAEDRTRNLGALYSLRIAQPEDNLYIKEGRTTIDLHFDREPRFYAHLGFDGGIWFGAGQTNDKNPSSLMYLGLKIGEADEIDMGVWKGTGYLPKKYQYFENRLTGNTASAQYSRTSYPWPLMRISDLYLLYAEAINEAEGPAGDNSSEMFEYINRVRARAGLNGVKESWDAYADNTKYSNQAGMRQIIRQERLIELVFEGHRFWDLRRWKTLPEEYQTPIEGWNLTVSLNDGTETEVNQLMYTRQMIFKQEFRLRDYFWPISNANLINNPNLVQNIGW